MVSAVRGQLLKNGVNLSLSSRQGTFRGALAPPRGKNIELRIAQFEAYRDRAKALGIARAVVQAKIRNGLAVLSRYEERKAMEGHAERIGQIESAADAAASADSVSSLDGIEGSAAKSYFALLMDFNTSGMTWPGRQKHPATDPLNALLSLTYTLVMNELTALIEGIGLDPYLGFLHQVDYGRPSLALDVLEPFRHPAADRLVLTLVNRGVIGADDFRSGGERPGVFLAPAAMKRFFGEYERWMLEKPKRDGQPGRSWRARFKDEVERLAAALRSGSEFAPFHFDATAKEEACSTSSVTI